MGIDKKSLSERDICTKFSLCDALEARLQSADALAERGRLERDRIHRHERNLEILIRPKEGVQ